MSGRKNIIAFEMFMQERPSVHYDSGEDGIFPECRSCRFHRPYAIEQTCVFRRCPYTMGQKSTERPVRWILAYVANPSEGGKPVESQHH